MWFVFLAFPVLEIYLLFKIGALLGLANTIFYLLASAVFGIGLIRTQGLYLLRNMQTSLSEGQVPANSLLHSLLIFLSGAFFIFPGFISDIVALLLLLPGSRHVVAFMMKRKLQQKLRDGSFTFTGFSAGPGGFSGRFGGFGRYEGPAQPMRDVSPLEIDSQSNHEVIDITPSKKD